MAWYALGNYIAVCHEICRKIEQLCDQYFVMGKKNTWKTQNKYWLNYRQQTCQKAPMLLMELGVRVNIHVGKKAKLELNTQYKNQ